MAKPMRLALLALLLIAAAGEAHNGEYRPPLPPPRIPDEPPPGTPVRPSETETPRGEVTPGEEEPLPGVPPVPESPVPMGPRTGFGRQDARFTVEIWWEANRHRFLPPLPELPMRKELGGILLDAAGTESEVVRVRILMALGRIGDPASVPALLHAIESGTTEIRATGILALGLSGAAEGDAKLKAIVADGEARLHDRTFAALGLGLGGRSENGSFLREVLREEWNPNIRAAAALALGVLRDRDAVEDLGRVLLALHPLRSPETAGPGDARRVVALECAAARALGSILTPRAYDYLVKALESSETPIRASAAIVLSAAAGTAGLPALRRGLDDGAPLDVRQVSLLGLCERNDPAGIAAARRILESPPERRSYVAPFAALALGLSRDPDGTELLGELLRDEEASRWTRAAAALALGLSGLEEAIEPLEKGLQDCRVPEIVGWGLLADALLSGEKAEALARRILMESDLPGPRRHAVTALGILAPDDVADLLVKELTDAYHVNREAALALARVDPDRCVRELTAKLHDPNVFAARFAATALGVLLDRRPPGVLADLVARFHLLSGSPVIKACVYEDNEYLLTLIRRF